MDKVLCFVVIACHGQPRLVFVCNGVFICVMFLLSSSVLFPNVIQTAFALGLSFIRPVCFDYCLVCEQFSVKDPEQLIFLTC